MGNIWVELKDKNKLYRNLILLKSYSLSNGHVNIIQTTENSVIKKSIKELLEDDFNSDFYDENVMFLYSQGIFGSYNFLSLTTTGIIHVEKLIEELTDLSEEDIETIKKNNTDKLLKFLDISSKLTSTVSPLINLLLKLNN